MTCTPLGLNTHRILVTGERVTPTPVEDIQAAGERPDIPGFPWWTVILGGTILAVGVYVWRAGYPRKTAADALRVGESSKISDSSPDQGDEPSLTIVLLREAIADGALVTIAMADSRGTLTHRTLKPLTLDSGRLRAADPARESELTVAIHRIASVTRLNQPHTTEPPAGN